MKLSPKDADLFYKLMWRLQFYVNQQLGIIPDITSVDDYRDHLTLAEKKSVRDALYENVHLIDAFVKENPFGLTDEELTIVQHWKNFVAGDFFIERFLKKAAYFINAEGEPNVYAVLGINDSIQDMLGNLGPPILVNAVLLPFKGRIIHDGLLIPYSIFFGSGISEELKDIYLRAKQYGLIIESLEPETRAPKQQDLKDWRPEVQAIVKASNQLKGQSVPIQSEAFALLKASARLTQAAVSQPEDIKKLRKEARKVERALQKLERALDWAEM